MGITRDGGSTWDLYLPDPLAALYSLTASDAQNAYAIGRDMAGQSVLLQTGDAGKTWKQLLIHHLGDP